MKELTCLIVDDEPPMVQRLESYFHRWAEHKLPFRLVGRAYSADEALELADQLRPDLIITDIVMPGKDGIALIREVRERQPRVEFLILSAYSDFSYAKQAIAMGVFEYLVKVPLREEDVRAALTKARDNMLAREQKEQLLQSLSGSAKENSHRLRKQLLEELLRGEVSPSAMERRSGDLVQGFEPRHYGCFAVRFDDYEAFCRTYSPADRNTLKYAMLNIMEEVLGSSGGACYACEIQPNVLVGLTAFRRGSEGQIDRDNYELGVRLHDAIQTYLRQSVSIGVSRTHSGWEQAAAAYGEAVAALGDTFYASFGMVVTPNRRIAYAERDWRELKDSFEQLLERVTAVSVGEELAPLLQVLHSCRVPAEQLLGYIETWCIRLRQRLLPTSQTAEAGPVSFGDCTHLHQLIERLRTEWELLSQQAESSGLRAEMVKAIRFVDDHLTESISLALVAEHIHLNPSYVSELFKKELGINFTDYVSGRRIERAIELLRKREYSNLELAEAVGIQNEKYFCTLFKKITGTSPQKFVVAGWRGRREEG
ncbi:response regulator transcription factor [Paenibacillus whitsoniae]|uniref:Response regulator n=1 Tax=Paenibacillus whitsoniae TaxID=2496558 RepID=A0A430J550_9BACL|nr:response regulator [Paenibacillus whitsoniae]RTE02353.1 response regulator [Paenibacillus whitsoniae]